MTFERIVDELRTGDVDARRKFSRRKLLGAFASVCHAVDFALARRTFGAAGDEVGASED
jgi:hypothetical protein